ncbi:MAG: cobalamin biosynthesis protein CbiA [Deltaproteobacteria bacterium]|nr:cobalamin biosynthesis protein CbiA [Deltaproteobacteria bacterium]
MIDFPGGREDVLQPRERVVIITGNYGSGKTEVAVNWTLSLARLGVAPLAIADLDLVNPYFRCREAAALMERHGIQVIAPRGEQFHSELPIVLPEIKGQLRRDQGVVVLDVGGDDVGARVLHSFAGSIGAHEMLQVVNAYRPFTDTVDGCVRIQEEIEAASGLVTTGIISNAHLMDDTDVDVIVRGAELAVRVAERRGLTFRFLTAMRPLAAAAAERTGLPVLVLDRWMVPPWKAKPREVGPLFKV